MAIHVEVSLIAVHALTYVIGQPTDSQNIPSAIQREPIIEVEALAGNHLLVDRFESLIVGLKRMCGSHQFDDTSGERSVASGSGPA